MLACPSNSETTLGCTPLVSSISHECLRSWNLMSGSPTRLRSRPWTLSRDLDAACVYRLAVSRRPSASTRFVNPNAVVEIGVRRRRAGRDNSPTDASPRIPKAADARHPAGGP
jgi:hypothetical protein